MAVVSTYIKREHAGAPFAPALLSSLSYLVGADVTELVVVVMCFVVARWKEGDADMMERVYPFHRVGSFYKASDMETVSNYRFRYKNLH